MNPLMLGQIPLLRERLQTNIALVRLLTVVPPDMKRQRRLMRERLSTNIAKELPLPGMHRHMIHKISPSLKSRLTKLATVRPIVRMDQLVPQQQLFMLEGLLALIAHEFSPVIVLRFAMVHQTARMVEDLIAIFTGISFIVGMLEHVALQTVDVGEGFVTFLALVRFLLIVHGFDVNFVVLSTGECFVAKLADYFEGDFWFVGFGFIFFICGRFACSGCSYWIIVREFFITLS